MFQFLQDNYGNIVSLLVVALIVFLAIRRMVLDKKAGIGACGQKCSECAKMAECSMSQKEKSEIQQGSICSGVCSNCQYSTSCHK